MLPRAYWKGSLKLSLVTCPVALYPAATTAERTRFHMINTETGNRLKQQMVDAGTGEVVEKEHKGRGYEVAKDKYVPIGKDELDSVRIESTRTLEIDSFVPIAEIDRRYLDRPYYLVPDGKAGADAFAVIRDAMKNKDRAALARVVLTNREYVVAIEPLGKGLVATTLRYADEVRDADDYFDDIRTPKVSKDMVELAEHILATKAAHFDPASFKDEYELALKALVKKKAAGKTITAPEPEAAPSNVVSLMDALRQSLKGKAPAQPATRRPAKKAARGKARLRKAG